MKTIAIVLLWGYILSCNGSGPATGTDDRGGDSVVYSDTLSPARDTLSLAGNWYLIPALPSDTGARSIPQLQFNISNSTFTGNTGCNSMSGRFEFTDTTLSFNDEIMLTKMACTGYNEQAFVQNLLRTDNYRFEDSVLVLMTQETELSRWARKPTKLPVVNRT